MVQKGKFSAATDMLQSKLKKVDFPTLGRPAGTRERRVPGRANGVAPQTNLRRPSSRCCPGARAAPSLRALPSSGASFREKAMRRSRMTRNLNLEGLGNPSCAGQRCAGPGGLPWNLPCQVPFPTVLPCQVPFPYCILNLEPCSAHPRSGPSLNLSLKGPRATAGLSSARGRAGAPAASGRRRPALQPPRARPASPPRPATAR